MNKRQAKKQYKKIHGYNPVNAQYNLTPEQVARMVESAKKAVAIMADTLADAADAISNAFRTTAENLRKEG